MVAKEKGIIGEQEFDMNRTVLLLIAAGLSVTASVVAARPADECPVVTLSPLTANELADLVRWGRERALAERTQEYHIFEEGHHGDQIERLASHLIDARYHVAIAEIDQLDLGQVQQARDELRQARRNLDQAMKEAMAGQRPTLVHASERLQRIERVPAACGAPAREEARSFYQRAQLALHQALQMF